MNLISEDFKMAKKLVRRGADVNYINANEKSLLIQMVQMKDKEKEGIANFSVAFDKNKIHDLFYNLGISYSEIVSTAEPAYSYIVYSRFLAIVKLNFVSFALFSLLLYPC